MNCIGQTSLNEPQTDLEDTEIASLCTINQMAQAIANSSSSDRDQSDIKQGHR
jgi:predicted hotdog family 3-hydroxylacyl-ACP dehydratase